MADSGVRGPTALGVFLRELRARAAEGVHRTGRHDWRTWWLLLVRGALGLTAVMIVLMLAARGLAAAGALDGEDEFLRRLGEAGPLRFSSAVFVQTIATDITLLILIAFTAGIAAWSRKPITAASIVASFVVTDLVVRFGWLIWERERPDIIFGGIASPGYHSFPSGHAAKAVAVYGLLTVIWIRASANTIERTAALFILAAIITLVPLGRISMGVHWPSDLVGGWILGLAWVAVLARGLDHETSGDARA